MARASTERDSADVDLDHELFTANPSHFPASLVLNVQPKELMRRNFLLSQKIAGHLEIYSGELPLDQNRGKLGRRQRRCSSPYAKACRNQSSRPRVSGLISSYFLDRRRVFGIMMPTRFFSPCFPRNTEVEGHLRLALVCVG